MQDIDYVNTLKNLSDFGDSLIILYNSLKKLFEDQGGYLRRYEDGFTLRLLPLLSPKSVERLGIERWKNQVAQEVYFCINALNKLGMDTKEMERIVGAEERREEEEAPLFVVTKKMTNAYQKRKEAAEQRKLATKSTLGMLPRSKELKRRMVRGLELKIIFTSLKHIHEDLDWMFNLCKRIYLCAQKLIAELKAIERQAEGLGAEELSKAAPTKPQLSRSHNRRADLRSLVRIFEYRILGKEGEVKRLSKKERKMIGGAEKRSLLRIMEDTKEIVNEVDASIGMYRVRRAS